MRLFLYVIAILLLTNSVEAQEAKPKETPITYVKERVILKPSEPNPATLQASTLFYVDVRNAGSAINHDWFQLTGFKPNTGLLLTYQTTQIVQIEPANIYAHYDIIAANPYGEIILILPYMVLAHLSESIATPEPAAAVLYVSAGTAEALGLKIGDHMEHRMFATRPKIIDAVTDTGAAIPATTPGININAPEILPAGNDLPAEEISGRRRPVGNPVITKPTPPNAPNPPKVEAPQAPNAHAGTSTNTNLATEPPPDAPAKPANEFNFLDQILKKQ